jgi:hypothetical protein
MKRTLLSLLLALAVMFAMVACSEKDDDNTGPNGNTAEPPALAQVADEVMAVPDSASLVNYTSEVVNYNGEDLTAYSLNEFLMQTMNDTLALEYTFEIASEDGYTPRQGGNPELTYADFATGYLLPTNKYRTFFPSDDIFTAYDVKWADHVNLYRTVMPSKQLMYIIRLATVTSTPIPDFCLPSISANTSPNHQKSTATSSPLLMTTPRPTPGLSCRRDTGCLSRTKRFSSMKTALS